MSRPNRSDAAGRAYLDLQNLARKTGRGTQEPLILYALERFLARLAAGRYAGTFVLKGGMLLSAVIPFADPVLTGATATTGRWQAASSSWQQEGTHRS